MSKHPDDGKYVVVQSGQRAGGLHETQDQAQKEANKMKRPVQEGKKATEESQPKVVRNLYG